MNRSKQWNLKKKIKWVKKSIIVWGFKGLENNKIKNCIFLDFGFETQYWDENIYIYM